MRRHVCLTERLAVVYRVLKRHNTARAVGAIVLERSSLERTILHGAPPSQVLFLARVIWRRPGHLQLLRFRRRPV